MSLLSRTPSLRCVIGNATAQDRGRPERFRSYGISSGVRADVGITIATGVSQWDNRLGTTNNFAQATGANQPAFVASAQNGKPGVSADGTNDSLTYTATLAQPIHIFTVAKWDTAPGAQSTLFDGPNQNEMRVYRQTGGSVDIVGDGGGADLSDSFHVYEAIFNGASSELKADGASVVTGTIASTAVGGAVLFAFGDGTSDPADATILEWIAFTAILNASAAQRLRSYAKAMYGL